jgi:outer membrane protein assembly factor BamB
MGLLHEYVKNILIEYYNLDFHDSQHMWLQNDTYVYEYDISGDIYRFNIMQMAEIMCKNPMWEKIVEASIAGTGIDKHNLDAINKTMKNLWKKTLLNKGIGKGLGSIHIFKNTGMSTPGLGGIAYGVDVVGSEDDVEEIR